jgi:hypothetical protein
MPVASNGILSLPLMVVTADWLDFVTI